MTDQSQAESQPRRLGRKSMFLGLALAAALGAAGFLMTYSGLVSGNWADIGGGASSPGEETAFIPVDELLVSIDDQGRTRHLRFGATLEVARTHRAAVADLMPRILDVLNGYLRALETGDLAEPGALVRLRAQMLRRIQIVTGDGLVHDLLVTEFVLN